MSEKILVLVFIAKIYYNSSVSVFHGYLLLKQNKKFNKTDGDNHSTIFLNSLLH